MITLIKNGLVLLPEGFKQIDLLFNDDKIINIGHNLTEYDQVIDAKSCYVSPGMIDIHVHGGGGHDFMESTVDAYVQVCEYHLHQGTTSIIPTAVTASNDQIKQFLEAYLEAASSPNIRSRLVGVHLEGPYLSAEKKGAHALKYLRNPDVIEYTKWISDYPIIKRMTVAPELEGAFELGDYLASKDINASIGHSNAYAKTILEAKKHGFTSVTHLYNAMSSVGQFQGSKSAGVAEMALLDKDLYVEIIADLKHVPAELVQFAYKNKTSDRLILVTDCLSPAGMDQGRYFIGPVEEQMEIDVSDAAYLHGQNTLAGSVSSVNHLLKNAVSIGIPLIDAIKMLTITPAKLLNVDHNIGSIEVNKAADFVILNLQLEVVHVICKGQMIK